MGLSQETPVIAGLIFTAHSSAAWPIHWPEKGRVLRQPSYAHLHPTRLPSSLQSKGREVLKGLGAVAAYCMTSMHQLLLI